MIYDGRCPCRCSQSSLFVIGLLFFDVFLVDDLFSYPPVMVIMIVLSGHYHDDPSQFLTLTTHDDDDDDDDVLESLCRLLMQGPLLMSLPFLMRGT